MGKSNRIMKLTRITNHSEFTLNKKSPTNKFTSPLETNSKR